MDWKPRICRQVPLYFENDETTRTTIVRACHNADWGEAGILDWWCTEHPEAFSADQAVYVTMEAELRRGCLRRARRVLPGTPEAGPTGSGG